MGKDQGYTPLRAWSEKAEGCLVTVSGLRSWVEGYRGEHSQTDTASPPAKRANKRNLFNPRMPTRLGIEALLVFATVFIAPLGRITAVLESQKEVPKMHLFASTPQYPKYPLNPTRLWSSQD